MKFTADRDFRTALFDLYGEIRDGSPRLFAAELDPTKIAATLSAVQAVSAWLRRYADELNKRQVEK